MENIIGNIWQAFFFFFFFFFFTRLDWKTRDISAVNDFFTHGIQALQHSYKKYVWLQEVCWKINLIWSCFMKVY